ncbi:hypothetical protein GIB67_026444 [Kingdonia uniflora]|uniref:Uncharacterized protein n=1 Tax=Kingdonia uniflora TaxID=39325 RepID=A0A7J7P691_9MAGN|nr:hypothetical protein GIB67_026444 [Kingdonia uniflora]
MLERILKSTVGDSTLPLGDAPLLGHYQFCTPEKTAKRMREKIKKEDGKRKKAEPGIKKGKREWQKKAEDADVPNKKKKKGEEKDNDDKKDVEEKVKSEEEEMEESKNGDEKVDGDEKFDDVVEVEDSEQPTVVVYYTEKKDLQPKNETMVVAEASVDQTTAVYVEEHTLEVAKIEDKASQTKKSKEEVKQNKEEVFEGKDDDDGNSQNKPDPEQLILMKSEVDVTLKMRHALIEEENNESTFKIAYRMNQLHAHFDEHLLGVLLESFIQRPISQDEKSQVDQVWTLRKDESAPEAKKGNMSTYMMMGEEPICLNALYTLYPNQ